MIQGMVPNAALSSDASYRQRSSSPAPLLPATRDLRAIVTKVLFIIELRSQEMNIRNNLNKILVWRRRRALGADAP
jgi:hypothetical protein